MTKPKSCDIKLPDGSAVVGLTINGAEYLITDALSIENHGEVAYWKLTLKRREKLETKEEFQPKEAQK